MESHQVNAKQGLQWILSGFYLFRKAPLAWMILCFTLLLIGRLMSLVPMLGMFIFVLISPAFQAGLMHGCKAQEQGKPLEMGHLFSAFRTNAAPLITIGGVSLIGQILILGLAMLIGGSQMTDMMLYGKRVDESELMGVMSSFLTSSLLILTLSIPLVMATWFSPLLVIFHDTPPIVAMQRSFFACLKNFIPFQIYGLALIILTALSLIPYGLGLIVLIPTMFTSIYVSYKDIFLGEPLRFSSPESEFDYQQATWATPSDEENSASPQSEAAPSSPTSPDTVQCAYCSTLVPRDRAIKDEHNDKDVYYCSEEHHQRHAVTDKPESSQ